MNITLPTKSGKHGDRGNPCYRIDIWHYVGIWRIWVAKIIFLLLTANFAYLFNLLKRFLVINVLYETTKLYIQNFIHKVGFNLQFFVYIC